MDPRMMRLLDGPRLFPQKIDLRSETALFIETDAQFYRSASFLDDRILSSEIRGFWASLSDLDQMPTQMKTNPAHWVFHHGHCGSTLLTRLLDATPQVIALREPGILRTIAELQVDIDTPESIWRPETFEHRLALFSKLFGRLNPGNSAAVVKPSSFCNDLGIGILRQEPRAKALGIFTTLEDYIATILGGENTPLEMRALAPMRLRRLNKRLGPNDWRLFSLRAGECAAMCWASEMAALHEVAAMSGSRWRWIEFERLLTSPREVLAEVHSHLGVSVPAAQMEAMLAGPIMQQYSKAPEHHFDLQTRKELLTEYRLAHADEILSGKKWLEAAARKFPKLSALVG